MLYLWDTNQRVPALAQELSGSGSLLREYHYGLNLVSMTSGSSAFYFHLDGLGSIDNLTSSTGVTQWTYEYHPYGAARTTTQNASKAPANLIQFAGQYLDPTGLYHMRARQHDSSSGRFLTVDPANSPVGRPYVSTYAYALDNPLRYVDPSGRESAPPSTSAPLSTSCPGAQGAGMVAFVGFGLIDLGLGLTLLFAPEIHAAPPIQALDLAVTLGALGAASDMVYYNFNGCPT